MPSSNGGRDRPPAIKTNDQKKKFHEKFSARDKLKFDARSSKFDVRCQEADQRILQTSKQVETSRLASILFFIASNLERRTSNLHRAR